jgi:CRP-like cAMP-binding protein
MNAQPVTTPWHESSIRPRDGAIAVPGPLGLQRLRGSLPRYYGRGDLLYSPSDRQDFVHVLERGLVRVFRISESGTETTLFYVAPGEIFGALPNLHDGASEDFAEAVQPSRVWKVPRACFEQALASDPALSCELAQQLGRRLQRTAARLEDLVFRDVAARVARVLVELGERFGQRDGERVRLDLPLTQAELAALVGSTRQSVNASLRDLETSGRIDRLGRRLLVFDPATLRDAARATLG